MGTNTFNLLILEMDEGRFQRLHSEKEGVALGMGGINENTIAEEAIQRAIKTLLRYQEKTVEWSVDSIYCFGTSAIRSANNQSVFLQRVKEETSLEIEVISGEREAELIYQGVRSAHTFEEDALIMDIGGGSTEFIWADCSGVRKSKSFEIGVSRIYQQGVFDDPYSKKDVAYIENYLEDQVGDFFADVRTNILLGASGSFETFYELIHEQAYPDNVYMELSIGEMMPVLEQIIASTQAARDENPFIIPIRKKMAPIAAIKIRWIIRKLGLTKVIISPYSLKEGVIEVLR